MISKYFGKLSNSKTFFNDTPDKVADTVSLAHQIVRYLKGKNIPIWLDYGSLLGATRGGAIADGDTDIDLSVHESDWSKVKSLLSDFSFAHMVFADSKIRIKVNTVQVIDERCKEMKEQHKPLDHLRLDTLPFNELMREQYDRLTNKELTLMMASAPSFHIDIFSFSTFHKTLCGSPMFYPGYLSKAYYFHNFEEKEFEGYNFPVLKYAEPYLDYVYQDIGGEGNTWRTPCKRDSVTSWAVGTFAAVNEDSVVGHTEGVFDCLHVGHMNLFRRMKEIFSKVVASCTTDEVAKTYKSSPIDDYETRQKKVLECEYVDEIIDPPQGSVVSIDYMNKNGLDYVVHGKTEEQFLRRWYNEAMEEKRLITFEETPGIRTQDIKDER